LTADFPGRVRSIEVRRPTLDDAFIRLTGRAIREEGAPDAVHERVRAWRRRR